MFFLRLFIILFLLFFYKFNNAQGFYTVYSMETGENSMTSGMYFDFTGRLGVKLENWAMSSAVGFSLSKTNEKIFNALNFDVSRDIQINKIPLTSCIFYQWNPFSERLHEHNAGLIFHYIKNKFGYHVGLNTRLFKLTNNDNEILDYEYTTIWEPTNLMYKITYYQPISNDWDFKASVTNFDAFVIQHETNPMLIANISYQLSHTIAMNMDLGYLQAGLMNIRVNYFGYFIRGGIQWKL